MQRGHTLHHNLPAPMHLPTDSYFAYDQAFEEVRRHGGFSGYAHQGELFNGRRGLALDVPFGIVDFIEVLQNGRLSTEGWYNFLNLGYRILPDAGSDFPYMDLPGVVRNYAKIDGPFSAEAWFAAFRRGHMYVTNGPLLEFTVNGQPMGAEVKVARGASLEVVAEADLNPDIDALSHVELVAHGEVIATEPANGRSRVSLRASVAADRSKWLAVRAWGRRQERSNMTVAHTAPVYVVVDGQPFWKPEAVAAIVAEQKTRLDRAHDGGRGSARRPGAVGDAGPHAGGVEPPTTGVEGARRRSVGPLPAPGGPGGRVVVGTDPANRTSGAADRIRCGAAGGASPRIVVDDYLAARLRLQRRPRGQRRHVDM